MLNKKHILYEFTNSIYSLDVFNLWSNTFYLLFYLGISYRYYGYAEDKARSVIVLKHFKRSPEKSVKCICNLKKLQESRAHVHNSRKQILLSF